MKETPQILIVEDEIIVATDIKSILLQYGYNVTGIAVSGAEAIEMVKSNLPDVVLMDIIIKGEMDGIKTAELIQQEYNLPVIFLTAHADRMTLDKVKKVGPYGYILKPFEPRVLQITIETALYKHIIEKELLDSRTWFSTTLQSIGDGVIATDNYGNITFINPIAEIMTGWTREEALNKPLNKVFLIYNEDTGLPCINPVEKVLRTKSIVNIENNTVLLSKKGSKIPIFDSAAPITDKMGHIIGTVLVFQDMTNRKNVETALKKAEKDKRMILDSLIENVLFLDTDLKIIWANKAATEFFQVQQEQILGHQCFNLWYGRFEPCNNCPTHKVLLTGQPQTAEIISHTGSILQIKAYPVKDDHGQLAGIVEVALDITSQKQAFIDKEKMEERLNLALNVTSDGLWDFNIATGEYYSSPRFYTMLGYEPNELPINKKNLTELLHPEDRDETIKAFNDHCQGITSFFETEFRLKTKTGDWKWILGRGKLVAGSNPEKPERFIGTNIDISERKELESKLIQAQKMDSIGNLAGGVAHDFNNMLGGILGYATLLRNLTKEPKTKKYIENIIASAERAAELTKQLLAFGRRGKNLVENININNTILEVNKILKHTIDKSIKIKTNLHKNLLLFSGDPTQIEQVVMNLTLNAVESMPNGGTLDIETNNIFLDENFCKAHPKIEPGNFICLQVSDTGYGMSEEIQKRIFEPFFTTKKDGQIKGTGLGLATVYGIVRNHNGAINVKSQINKGSAFNIYFPANEQKITCKLPPKNIDIKAGKGTILIIDDEEIVRDMLAEMLTSFGYHVLSAGNGKEAINIYKEHYSLISLVLVDMIMPELGGKETFIELKKINPNIRALLATGYAQDGRAQEIINLGVLGFIQKPFSIAELSQKVNSILVPVNDTEN